ncbi:MAG: tetratricopeptide repeat protein, partial [Gemmatimonadaceae bacterium]
VLQDGERVRITATLIDAARNTPIWGERFERERSDILALQREVALAIARAIEIALTPQDLARLEDTTEVDPEAFDLYVRGTQARYKILNSGVEAESYFARAVAEDSSYAPAYAGLAFVHTFSGDETRAREFAEKALRLDPKLAEAHVARGMIRQTFDWDWEGAENEFRQAIRLNPGYAEAHHELSMLLQRRSQFDEALLEARRTLYLAPMSARFEQGLGEIQFYARRYDEALRAAGKVIALDSNYAAPYGLRGSAYMYLGRYDESVEAFKKCIKLGCEADENLGYIYAVTGRRAEAVRVIDSLKARWKERKGFDAVIAPHGIAVVYAGLGEREQAVDWLERAVERGDFFMLYLGIDPAFRSLHAEPRFRALLKKVGLDKNDRVAPRAPPR